MPNIMYFILRQETKTTIFSKTSNETEVNIPSSDIGYKQHKIRPSVDHDNANEQHILDDDNDRKTVIFDLHYHKTGHDLSMQYRAELQKLIQKETLKQLCSSNIPTSKSQCEDRVDEFRHKKQQISCKQLTSTSSICNKYSIYNFCPKACGMLGEESRNFYFFKSTLDVSVSYDYVKRTHSKTGCPKHNDIDVTRKKLAKISYINLGVADLFCSMEEFNKLFDRKYKYKFVNAIRLPLEMMISNYYYHSAMPTPEHWVNHYDPCEFQNHHELENYFSSIKNVTIFNETEILLLTHDEINLLKNLCHQLMNNIDTGVQYQKHSNDGKSIDTRWANDKSLRSFRHYYDALLNLPALQGIKLVIIQQLLSKHCNGSDLLRMIINSVRLHEYTTSIYGNNNNAIFTTRLDTDYSDQNYNETIERKSNFILFDITDDNVSKNKSINELVANVYKRYRSRFETHSTKGKYDAKEKEQLKEQIMKDELFGPIIRRLTNVINNHA